MEHQDPRFAGKCHLPVIYQHVSPILKASHHQRPDLHHLSSVASEAGVGSGDGWCSIIIEALGVCGEAAMIVIGGSYLSQADWWPV